MLSHTPGRSEFEEVSKVKVGGVDLRGHVFVIPLDAPVPSELSSAPMPKGSLYDRLGPLAKATEAEFSFVPLSGAELLSLERAWRQLQTVAHVSVLFELPGARYDILFTQATRQIGLTRVEWTQVSDSLTSRLVETQRLKDTKPWASGAPISGEDDSPSLPRSNRSAGPTLATPPDDEVEDDDQ